MKTKTVRFLGIAMLMALFQLMVVSTSLAAPVADGNWGAGSYHTVSYGETLFSIGRMYGVYPYAIAEANGLPNPDCIYAGQVLYIPQAADWEDDSGCTTNCAEPDYGCTEDCWQEDDGCGNDCNNTGWNPQYGYNHPYNYGYGYDNGGYYYYNNYNPGEYKQYSYACGYYYNCY